MIPVFKPYLDKNEYQAAQKALKIGWLGQGKFVEDFEKRISNLLGIKRERVVCVNSGTSALKIAFHLAGVCPGDEVITPSFNNIGVIQSITDLGAKPVFCDIKYDDMTMNPENIIQLINSKTKAINCLDYASNLCDLKNIKKIAKKFKLKLIYDAAHTFGSKRNGKFIGSNSNFCTFSFDPVKTVTSVDGGAIIFKNINNAKKARYLRLLGQRQNQKKLYQNSRSWIYDVKDQGYRFHLSNINASIGIEQIKKIKEIETKRTKVFLKLNKNLTKTNMLILPKKLEKDIIPFIYVVRLKRSRDKVMNFMKKNNIDCGIHWQPCHKFSKFKKSRSGNLKITEKIGNEILTLPMYPSLSTQEIKRISKYLSIAVDKFCKN